MKEIKEIIVGVVKKGEKILILHRQQNKQFDPNRWEFVSAFVKDRANLQGYAAEQVSHETGLDTQFLKAGKDFTVHDEYGQWLIHPFLFGANSEVVQIRPEDHSEYIWVLSKELKSYPVVKDLDKNLSAFG